jgi:hypothetical protein
MYLPSKLFPETKTSRMEIFLAGIEKDRQARNQLPSFTELCWEDTHKNEVSEGIYISRNSRIQDNTTRSKGRGIHSEKYCFFYAEPGR